MLPIVQRELMVAARRRTTHWVRLGTTGFAMLITFFFMLVSFLLGTISPGAGMNQGHTLFLILSYYALGLSLLAGVLLAGDCVSEEKREGTLGLLFLTDLSGFDVVFGKLASAGLNAGYGLLASLPVFGFSLLLGGTTGGEFFRVSLALVNILFFAMVSGILASVVCRKSLAAFVTTALIVLSVVALPPLLSGLFGMMGADIPIQGISPFTAFTSGMSAYHDGHPSAYWHAMLFSFFLSFGMLVTAAIILPRTWQDSGVEESPGKGSFAPIFAPSRKPLRDGNPIVWLLGRNRWLKIISWTIAVGGLVLAAGIYFFAGGNLAVSMSAGSWVAWLFLFFLKLLFAYQACWLFADSRRTGALELIASSPLTNREIISGQWKVLMRTFLPPVIVLICIGIAAQLQSLFFQRTALASASAAMAAKAGSGQNFGVTFGTMSFYLEALMAGNMILYPVYVLAEFAATGFLGMWLGLSAPKPGSAVGFTILFAIILPHVVFCFPRIFILGVHVFLIFWARRKMQEDFRRMVIPQPRFTPLVSQPLPAPPPRIS